MATVERELYQMRAVQLAIVYLTRRDDLAVQNPLPDTGLDLMVALTQEGPS